MRENAVVKSASGVVPPEGLRPPQGLNAAMEGLAREVLLKAPSDLFTFAADYFEKLIRMRNQFTFDGRPTDIAHLVNANLNNKRDKDGIDSVGNVLTAKNNDLPKMQKNNLSRSQERNDFLTKRQNDKLKSISLDNHLISSTDKSAYPVEKRVKLIRIPSYPKSLESEFEKDITRQLIDMESKEKIKNMTSDTETLKEVIQQTFDDNTHGEKLEINIAESVAGVKKDESDDKMEPNKVQPEHEMIDAIKINDDFINEESVEKVENIIKSVYDVRIGSEEEVVKIEDNHVISINDEFIKAESGEKVDDTEKSNGDVVNAPEEVAEVKQVLNQSVEVNNVDTECKVYVGGTIEENHAETLEDPQEPAKTDEGDIIDGECNVEVVNKLEKDDVKTVNVSEELSKSIEVQNKVDVENISEKEDADSIEELKQIVEAKSIDSECKVHMEDEVGEFEKGDAENLQDTEDRVLSVDADDSNTEVKEEVEVVKEDKKQSDIIAHPEQIDAIKNDDEVKEGSNENLNQKGVENVIVIEGTDPNKESNSSIINETKTLLQEENKLNVINIISGENISKEEHPTNNEETLHEEISTTTMEPISSDDNFKDITTSFIHHEKLLADNLVQTKYHDEANNVKISEKEHGSNQDENEFLKAITNAENTLLGSQKISIENQEDVADTLNENNANTNNSGNTSTLLEDIISINNLEKNDIIQIMHASVDNSPDKVSVREKRSISTQEYDPEIGIGNRSSFTDITESDFHSLDTQNTDTEVDGVFIVKEGSLLTEDKKAGETINGDDATMINETLGESAPSVLNDEKIILDVQSPAIRDDIVTEDVCLSNEAILQGEDLEISEGIIQKEHKDQDKRNVLEASDVDLITKFEKLVEHFTNEETDMTQTAFEKNDSKITENHEQESEDRVNNAPVKSNEESENTIQNVEKSIYINQNNIESMENELENDLESIEIKATKSKAQNNVANGMHDLIKKMSPTENEHIETETIVANNVPDQIHNSENANQVDLEVRSISKNKEDDNNSSTEISETAVKSEKHEKKPVIQKEEVIVPINEEGESKDTILLIKDAGIVTNTITKESSKNENEHGENTSIEENSGTQIDKSQSMTVENEFLKANTDSENEQNESPYLSDGNNMLEKASILIQKVYRGFRVRKNLSKPLVKKVESHISAVLSKGIDEDFFGENNAHDKDEINDNPKNLMRTISYQAAMDNKLYTVSEERNSYSTEEESSTFSSAATKIQAGVRGFLTRKYFRTKTGNSTDTTAPSIGEDSRSLDEMGNSGEPNTDDTVNQMIVATSSILLEQLEHFENLEEGLENKTIPDINLIEANKESVEYIGRSNQNRKRLRREDAIQIQSPYSSGETPINIRQASKASEDEEPIGDLAQSIITEIVSNTYTPVVQIKQNTKSPQLTPLSEPLNSGESDDEKVLDKKPAKSSDEETNTGKEVLNTNDPKDDSRSENTIEIPELNLHSYDDDEESQATTISPDLGMAEKNIINESVVNEDRVRNALPRYISTDVETLVSKHFKENMEDIVEAITSPTSVSGMVAEKEQQKTDVLDSVEPPAEENYIHTPRTSAEKIDLNKFSAILHSGEFHDTLVLPTKIERKLNIQKE